MFYVYMLTNHKNTVLYTGVTNDLQRRLFEHRSEIYNKKGFTRKYSAYKLVYFESTESSYSAISREKEIKGWSRQKKDELVNTMNPDWIDLAINLFA